MLAVKRSPRNAVGLVRKYSGHIVYSLHSLSGLGTAESQCSTIKHSGIKTLIIFDISLEICLCFYLNAVIKIRK